MSCRTAVDWRLVPHYLFGAWFARMSHRGAVVVTLLLILAVGSASEHGDELAVATEVSHLTNAPPLTPTLTFTVPPLIRSCVRGPGLCQEPGGRARSVLTTAPS